MVLVEAGQTFLGNQQRGGRVIVARVLQEGERLFVRALGVVEVLGK